MGDIPAWADVLLAIAAVFVALGTIYRYVLPAVKGAYRIVRGTARLVDDFQTSGGFAGLAAQNAALAADMAAVKKELYPNGGTSMRDSLTRTEATVTILVDKTEANREGISDLRDQVNDVSRRATDVAEVAQVLGERQEVLRAADQQFIRELQHYIETQYSDLLLANEGLRASLNESLGIAEDEP